MTAIFRTVGYPSSGTIPAYNSANGNVALEITGANGRKLRLNNMDVSTTYGPFDNMTLARSTTYNGTPSIQVYIANGDGTSSTTTINADPYYFRIGGAPSPATGFFYGEIEIETGIATDTYEPLNEASGVTVTAMDVGTGPAYVYEAPIPTIDVCFWQDLVRASQNCEGPPAMRADAALPPSGYYWDDIAWYSSPLMTPPTLPLTYPSPVDVPIFISGTGATTLTEARASNTASAGGFTGGGLNVDANLSFDTNTVSLSNSTVYAYTAGSGPRIRQVFAEFETNAAYTGMPAGFTRNPADWLAGDGASFYSRTQNCRYLATSLSVTAPGMVTNATVRVAFTGFSGVDLTVVTAAPVGTGTYTSGGGVTNSAGQVTIDAQGSPYSDYISVQATSGGNVTNPASMSFTLDGLGRRVYPLRKIIAYLENVVKYEDVLVGDDMFAIPEGGGVSIPEKIAIIDENDSWFIVQAGYPDVNTAFVGDLIDADDPGTSLGKMIVWREVGG